MMWIVATLIVLCLDDLGGVSVGGNTGVQKTGETSSYMGREFVFSLIDVLTYNQRSQHFSKRVDFAAKEGGHIFVYYAESKTNDSFFIAPYGHVSTVLKTQLPRDGTFEDHVAIRITSNTDITVLVTEGNPYDRMVAYVVYPVAATKGTHFITAAFAPIQYMNYASRVMVMALKDGTKVSVNDGNQSISAHIDSLDVFQYDAPDYADLTGAVITSIYDVIVLSGTSASMIPSSRGSYFPRHTHFPLAAQMLQTKSYRYIVPQTEASQPMIVTVLSDTAYNVTMINKTNAVTYTTNGTQTFALGTEPVSLLTSVSISLAQYNNPFMALVPAVTQYLSEYTFVVPNSDSKDVNLVAIVPSNASSGLLLDGAAFTGTEQRIQSVDDWYTIVTGKVESGFHYMTNQNSAVKFGLLVYSRDPNAAYGFYVGMDL